MIKNSLPEVFLKNPNLHAYMYVSPDTSARRENARLIAKSMLCRNRDKSAVPCGECDCCTKMNAATHPDCIFVSGTEKTTVEDIKKIEEEAYLASNEADSKVFILEDADEYNDACQNKLLKIIEEPPKGVKFVLTASSVSAILPTVRSRVCAISGQVRDADSLMDEVRKAKRNLTEEKIVPLAHFLCAYEKSDIGSIDETAFFDYIEKAYLFLSAKDKAVILSLPKKREDLMLCLQVFMLCVRQTAIVKVTGKITDGILSSRQLSECNLKTSMKRAHMLYDVLEQGYLLSESYANANAVNSYLIENLR